MNLVRRPSSILTALVAVSVAGVADVGEFVATRPGMFTTAPGRAAGSVFGLAIWAALAGVSAQRLRGADGTARRWATVGLAGVAALGGLGLAAIHVKAGVGGARTIAGGLLGVAALGLAVGSLSGAGPESPATSVRGPAPS